MLGVLHQRWKFVASEGMPALLSRSYRMEEIATGEVMKNYYERLQSSSVFSFPNKPGCAVKHIFVLWTLSHSQTYFPVSDFKKLDGFE